MFLESILDLPVQDVSLDVFRSAVSVNRRFGLSVWDSAILAAVRACGCDTVYSEDMSDRQEGARHNSDSPGCWSSRIT